MPSGFPPFLPTATELSELLYGVSIGIRGEAVQLHTKVYTFSFENIFCTCLPHTHKSQIRVLVSGKSMG